MIHVAFAGDAGHRSGSWSTSGAARRRIRDGEALTRRIEGQACIAEAHDLLKNGIMVRPAPTPTRRAQQTFGTLSPL